VYTARIRVTLRPSILDPQGKAVQHAIASLGAGAVSDVRIGKYIEAKIDATSEAEARRTADEVCKKLLANPVMEDYTFDIAGDA
jgi:phosphoribosylformylglycinamidine synthase subunit PurS